VDGAETRRRLIHRVFTGVNMDDTDLVGNALAEFEVDAHKRGFSEGWLRGVAVGMLWGAALGALLVHSCS
jgi:hypothetical protein